ncbi:hypothetical protein [Saccharopolyspora cebuensis]|uniref:Uncharacterized protein n=1 Tax=Saccharopolyspora cebuensis TaxID=418759 RepID=A0ABV4CSD3_9PSEU
MPSTQDLAELRRTLNQLRSGVGALRTRYGDVPGVRRLSNDLDRFDIDLADLSAAMPVPRRSVEAEDVVLVPDTPYDPELWRDADDEGIGGRRQ